MEQDNDQEGSQEDSFLWSPRTILEREIQFAQEELRRPAVGLLLSGLVAGLGVMIGPLLALAIETVAGAGASSLAVRLLAATAYSAGFIIIILAHTDLFTEYTTMALLPIMAGEAPKRDLARLWSLVYAGNMVGVVAFCGFTIVLSPHLDALDGTVIGEAARRLTDHPWWVLVLSGVLTGWLMGFLSWLVSAAGEGVSQIVFVWLIGATIGFFHLPHAISGTGEVLMGSWFHVDVSASGAVAFVLWATVGNSLGGILFAFLISSSVLVGGRQQQSVNGRRKS